MIPGCGITVKVLGTVNPGGGLTICVFSGTANQGLTMDDVAFVEMPGNINPGGRYTAGVAAGTVESGGGLIACVVYSQR